MLTELRKSIGYIIYERTTSPLWGSFIFSWLVCNWKIVFTVFIISNSKLAMNKIDYINQNYINWKPLILYPFISTFILITILPLLSNGAYWITIIYLKWRIDKKNAVEKKQLLSIEQSIAIRISNSQIEENYNRLIGERENEIKLLKLEIDELEKKLSEPGQVLTTKISENSQKTAIEEWNKEYVNFSSSTKFEDFEKILKDINSGESRTYYTTPQDSMIYFESVGAIKKVPNKPLYELTAKGSHFSKLFNKNKYERN